jgi:chromosomal replication initiation ATPase DnaA
MKDLTEAVIQLHNIARFVDRNIDAKLAKEIRRTADKLNKHTEVKDERILQDKKTTV